jgi:hypothetical protein
VFVRDCGLKAWLVVTDVAGREYRWVRCVCDVPSVDEALLAQNYALSSWLRMCNGDMTSYEGDALRSLFMNDRTLVRVEFVEPPDRHVWRKAEGFRSEM